MTKIDYYRVGVRFGAEYGIVVRAADNIPSVGDTLDSVASCLDHTSPNFKLFDDVTIEEIIAIVPHATA